MSMSKCSPKCDVCVEAYHTYNNHFIKHLTIYTKKIGGFKYVRDINKESNRTFMYLHNIERNYFSKDRVVD